MCGPADFAALGQCGARLAALAAAGGGLVAAMKAARILGDLLRKEEERKARAGAADAGERS